MATTGPTHPFYNNEVSANTRPSTASTSQHAEAGMKPSAPPATGGHNMHPDDPDNPQNWPAARKVYASLTSGAFAFVIAFGLTAYTTSLMGIQKAFSISMTDSILGFSLYLWGIAFAPIYVPHLSERFGRRPIYFGSIFIFSLFILGAAVSETCTSLLITRFFAGMAGGPCLVLIEGTFADVWSGEWTVTYYVFLTLASFIGAASGPLVGGYVDAFGGWRWTQWITLIAAAGALLLGIGMPETYPREILRSRARRQGKTITLAPAQSGVTIAQMATHTIINPLKMAVAEPIVVMLSSYVGFVFAVIFQFFITIPIVLSTTYKFTVPQVGLAFISAIIGSLLAALTAVLFDLPSSTTRPVNGRAPELEYRLRSGMFGGILIAASLFWVAFTASPTMHSLVPITGTMVFIWGSVLVLTSAISYIFDAYPAPGTLAALTTAAVFRIAMAGFLPMVIVQFVMKVTGKWAVATFGFIGIGLMLIPWVLYFWGQKLREGSRYNRGSTMAQATMAKEEGVEGMN